MKILTTQQVKECDEYTIKNSSSISSISLMERAAIACTDWIAKNIYHVKKVNIFCGIGNNGGDGFAIARLLKKNGFYVKVFTVATKNMTPDTAKNFKILRENGDIEILPVEKAFETKFEENSCIIDALLGTGINRKVEGVYEKIILYLNELKNVHKIAIDMPSGLNANDNIEKDAVVFKADYTLSFQFWKRSFLHPETGMYAGKVHILDIQLKQDFIDKVDTDFYVNDHDIISKFFKKREDFVHKGTFGKSAIVSGSYGKMGAAVLAVSAALRAGSGLVYSISVDAGYTVMQSTYPEAIFINGGDKFITKIDVKEDFTTGIGPGIGLEPETQTAVINYLKTCKKPLVLDADALNILGLNKTALKYIPAGSILTPHPKEFERIFGEFSNSYDRSKAAREQAKKHSVYIVLKDHRTQVITPEGKVYYNITGNSGMAKGGSGDALTGIISSFLAQGYTSLQAALLGVWIHGKAGDLATKKYAKESALPSALIEQLGEVFHLLNDD